MAQPFPPHLGARIAGRFELIAPLRGEGPARAFLAHDRQTGKRTALSLFDPSRATATAWTEYVRILKSSAGIPGLAAPREVASAPPDPPHVVEDPPAHRALDRLLVQERRLPWQRAVTIGERVAAVLQAALAATQASHRALTPYRVTVDKRDEVQVLDHGVAVFDAPADPPEEPDYRAPEQRDRAGDSAADIYSLALIVHGLVSGAAPTDTPPAPLTSVPLELATLLERALAAEPARRPAWDELRAGMRVLLGLPTLQTSEPAAESPPEPAAVREEPPRRQPTLVASTPLVVAPAPRKATATRAPPETRRPSFESSERAEVVSSRPAVAPETTLVLPPSVDPPTEQTRLPPNFSSRLTPVPAHDERTEQVQLPSLSRPPAPARTRSPSADDADERTTVYTARMFRSPAPASPGETDFFRPSRPERASDPTDRTEVLPASPAAKAPAEALERTELVHPLKRPTMLQKASARPNPSVVSDDACTVDIYKPSSGPRAKPPADASPTPAMTNGVHHTPPAQPLSQFQPAPLRTLLICCVCLSIALLLAIIFPF